MKSKQSIIIGVAYLFILLFLYTAFSKLFAFRVTLFDMLQNPFLSQHPLFWTVFVPTVEVIISGLLFFSTTRRIGLWASLVIMIAFTGYVGLLLHSNYKLPCTCGGILRELSWRQHLWVNIGLVLLALMALTFRKAKTEAGHASRLEKILRNNKQEGEAENLTE